MQGINVRRSATERAALSPGQLAKRWGVGISRVNALVSSGLLGGAFTIPTAGRHGEALRIPLSSILDVEREWCVVKDELNGRSRPRRRGAHEPVLQHFPELMTNAGDDAESHAADPC